MPVEVEHCRSRAGQNSGTMFNFHGQLRWGGIHVCAECGLATENEIKTVSKRSGIMLYKKSYPKPTLIEVN